jgi:hypothetical protein
MASGGSRLSDPIPISFCKNLQYHVFLSRFSPSCIPHLKKIPHHDRTPAGSRSTSEVAVGGDAEAPAAEGDEAGGQGCIQVAVVTINRP